MITPGMNKNPLTAPMTASAAIQRSSHPGVQLPKSKPSLHPITPKITAQIKRSKSLNIDTTSSSTLTTTFPHSLEAHLTILAQK
jgi:hypothetical protein